MIVRAAAFQVQPSEEKTKDIFGKTDEVFRGKALARCRRCRKDFSLVFALVDDEDNPTYLTEIERMISGDCENGQHSEQFVFKTRP